MDAHNDTGLDCISARFFASLQKGFGSAGDMFSAGHFQLS